MSLVRFFVDEMRKKEKSVFFATLALMTAVASTAS